jgi:Na+-transporting NADH:ubiquinone oxidoreductase subunit NqrF
MCEITVFGKASKRIILSIDVKPENQELTLLNYLEQRGIPVASSCYGEGVCQKCTFNNSLLSCKLTLKELNNRKISRVTFDYL